MQLDFMYVACIVIYIVYLKGNATLKNIWLKMKSYVY